MQTHLQILLITLAILACAVVSPLVAGQPDEPPLVQLELIPDTTAITPGKPFLLGIRFQMRSPWHIYWRNPGDSGSAPTISLTKPDGFTTKALRFPAPIRLVSPGNITNYVYVDHVILFMEVTPPANLETAHPVTLKVEGQWLVCDEETCLPGEGSATLTIPVATPDQPAKPANSSRLAPFLRTLPRGPMTVTELATAAGFRSEWETEQGDSNIGDSADTRMLSLVLRQDENLPQALGTIVDFFPLSHEDHDHAIFVSSGPVSDGGYRLTFRKTTGSRDAAIIRGVLVLKSPVHSDLAYLEINAPQPH